MGATDSESRDRSSRWHRWDRWLGPVVTLIVLVALAASGNVDVSCVSVGSSGWSDAVVVPVSRSVAREVLDDLPGVARHSTRRELRGEIGPFPYEVKMTPLGDETTRVRIHAPGPVYICTELVLAYEELMVRYGYIDAPEPSRVAQVESWERTIPEAEALGVRRGWILERSRWGGDDGSRRDRPSAPR